MTDHTDPKSAQGAGAPAGGAESPGITISRRTSDDLIAGLRQLSIVPDNVQKDLAKAAAQFAEFSRSSPSLLGTLADVRRLNERSRTDLAHTLEWLKTSGLASTPPSLGLPPAPHWVVPTPTVPPYIPSSATLQRKATAEVGNRIEALTAVTQAVADEAATTNERLNAVTSALEGLASAAIETNERLATLTNATNALVASTNAGNATLNKVVTKLTTAARWTVVLVVLAAIVDATTLHLWP